MKTSGYTSLLYLLGDKTIMESIYRLVRHQENGFSDAISYIHSLSTGGINDSHE
jgi:hypothetical protein